MSRIRKFYERRFAELLAKSGSCRDSPFLFQEAHRISVEQNVKLHLALAILHGDLRRNVGETQNFPQKFMCDVGLGGLTRWLRGAGYETCWKPGLDDAAVIRETEQLRGTLVTTDSLMTERGVLRDGLVPWIWVSSSLTLEEQLMIVLREMDLPLREPRCMQCGGALRRVDKTEVLDRIPPRTALWLQEYFLCCKCDQLFWRGTHWKNIAGELRRLSTASHALGSPPGVIHLNKNGADDSAPS